MVRVLAYSNDVPVMAMSTVIVSCLVLKTALKKTTKDMVFEVSAYAFSGDLVLNKAFIQGYVEAGYLTLNFVEDGTSKRTIAVFKDSFLAINCDYRGVIFEKSILVYFCRVCTKWSCLSNRLDF